MVELTNERFAELVIAEYHMMRIRKIVAKKSDEFGSISYDELEMLRDLICPDEEEG
jgi:hypothetical protein